MSGITKSKHSRRSVLSSRSQKAFARGLSPGFRVLATPALARSGQAVARRCYPDHGAGSDKHGQLGSLPGECHGSMSPMPSFYTAKRGSSGRRWVDTSPAGSASTVGVALCWLQATIEYSHKWFFPPTRLLQTPPSNKTNSAFHLENFICDYSHKWI